MNVNLFKKDATNNVNGVGFDSNKMFGGNAAKVDINMTKNGSIFNMKNPNATEGANNKNNKQSQNVDFEAMISKCDDEIAQGNKSIADAKPLNTQGTDLTAQNKAGAKDAQGIKKEDKTSLNALNKQAKATQNTITKDSSKIDSLNKSTNKENSEVENLNNELKEAQAQDEAGEAQGDTNESSKYGTFSLKTGAEVQEEKDPSKKENPFALKTASSPISSSQGEGSGKTSEIQSKIDSKQTIIKSNTNQLENLKSNISRTSTKFDATAKKVLKQAQVNKAESDKGIAKAQASNVAGQAITTTGNGMAVGGQVKQGLGAGTQTTGKTMQATGDQMIASEDPTGATQAAGQVLWANGKGTEASGISASATGVALETSGHVTSATGAGVQTAAEISNKQYTNSAQSSITAANSANSAIKSNNTAKEKALEKLNTPKTVS